MFFERLVVSVFVASQWACVQRGGICVRVGGKCVSFLDVTCVFA